MACRRQPNPSPRSPHGWTRSNDPLALPAVSPPAPARRPTYLVGGLVAALASLAVFGLWMQGRVDARLNAAAAQVAAAERERDATTSVTREEAARQVAEARAGGVRGADRRQRPRRPRPRSLLAPRNRQ